jgi:hypothetical protein
MTALKEDLQVCKYDSKSDLSNLFSFASKYQGQQV